MRGDAGETERGPSRVMAAGPLRASALSLALGPPHLPIHPPSWFPATFHPPHPPPPKGEKKKKKRRWKEGKQNIYSCRDKGRKIEANIHNFLCGALQ